MEDLGARLEVRPAVQLLTPRPLPKSLSMTNVQPLSWVPAQKLPLKFKSLNQDLSPKGSHPRKSTFAPASSRTPPSATATG